MPTGSSGQQAERRGENRRGAGAARRGGRGAVRVWRECGVSFSFCLWGSWSAKRSGGAQRAQRQGVEAIQGRRISAASPRAPRLNLKRRGRRAQRVPTAPHPPAPVHTQATSTAPAQTSRRHRGVPLSPRSVPAPLLPPLLDAAPHRASPRRAAPRRTVPQRPALGRPTWVGPACVVWVGLC